MTVDVEHGADLGPGDVTTGAGAGTPELQKNFYNVFLMDPEVWNTFAMHVIVQ